MCVVYIHFMYIQHARTDFMYICAQNLTHTQTLINTRLFVRLFDCILFVCHALLLYVNCIACDYAYACACAHTQITHHITVCNPHLMTIFYCMTVRNVNICVAILFSYMMFIFTTMYLHLYVFSHIIYTCACTFFVQCPCLLSWTYLYVFAFVQHFIMMPMHAN